ncbi:MAG: biotin/lipoyl-binding protein, partial [Bacteroidetes bacterium]
MKTKLFITFLLPCILFSCHGGGDNPVHEEYEEDTPEGVVFLTERQQKALGLELGTFQMRNLTTVVKTNGQLEVPPAASAEVTAIIGGNAREIKVFHGDRVRKGQALAVLEHPDYIVLQEQFAEIASQLKFLEQEFER